MFIMCNMHASSRGTIAAIVCAREAVVAWAIVVARNVCDRRRYAGVWERPGVGDSRVFNEGVVSEGTLFAGARKQQQSRASQGPDNERRGARKGRRRHGVIG